MMEVVCYLNTSVLLRALLCVTLWLKHTPDKSHEIPTLVSIPCSINQNTLYENKHG